MFDYISHHWIRYTTLVTQHILLSATALVVCICVGGLVGTLCFRNRWFHVLAMNTSGAVRVIPSLVILLLLMPILGTGFFPAVTALVLLGLPPVIIGTALALDSIDGDVIEAALSCGMNDRRIFREIRLPLAMPMIITGMRLSALSIAAGATLAAYVGAGGLGELILSGLSQYRMDILLAGAVTTMAISLAIEAVFQLLHAMATRHRVNVH